MREIVLDTETTGLDPSSGHRIVEIGCVELFNHFPTGQTWHRYINPQRPMPPEAFKVHGLSDAFLADKPIFSELADEFLDYVGDALLIIHNASFDIKFLNAELKGAGRPSIEWGNVLDTLALARRKHPGAQNNLDALCRRFKIDNTSRKLHGALLDSQLLAEVYLELIGGHQADLQLSTSVNGQGATGAAKSAGASQRPEALAPRLSQEEIAAHEEFIRSFGGERAWGRIIAAK